MYHSYPCYQRQSQQRQCQCWFDDNDETGECIGADDRCRKSGKVDGVLDGSYDEGVAGDGDCVFPGASGSLEECGEGEDAY